MIQGYSVCSFCASHEIVWKADNCFVCQGCHKENYINASTAAGVFLYNDKGQVLIAQRARDPDRGKYDDPGGFVDLVDNTVEVTVAREILEELGIIIDPTSLNYLGSEAVGYFYQGRTMPVMVICFFAYLTPEQCDAIVVSDDVSSIKRVSRDSFDPSVMVTVKKAQYVKKVFDLIGS